MNDMDDKSDVSMDKIPDLIKVGAIPSEYGQMLHTDVIDPVTFNQNRCRFTLQRVAGFLHSDSKITLAVIPKTTNAAYYPVNIGISNLIESARLSIGNKTVCEISDYTHFNQYQSMFISNEDNKEREQFLSQRCINHQPIYDDRVANVTDKPPNSAKKIGLDVGRNPIVPAAGGAGVFNLLPFMVHGAGTAQDIEDAPVYSVYLSDLFPFLKYNQLPMFMLNEEVHIDITFTPQTTSLAAAGLSRRMCITAAEGGTPANQQVAYDINQNEVKLIYDSITYEGGIMEQYAKQNPKLTFQYVDYRLAKRTGDQGEFANLTFPIGGNGRLVSKVILGLQEDKNFTPVSLCHGVVAKDVPSGQKLALNLLYNDLFEFNTDRDNSSLLFHTTQQAEGKVPMVTADEYQRNPTTALTDEAFEGHTQSSETSGLGGIFRWTAIRPNKGQRVNNKGMDLTFKAGGLPAETYTLRVYLELLKVATIEDGRFSCYFA
tara:strand:- start:2505 stop:3965 length:1461 start_codon:yes stop_codon:yes gene_type:complete